MDENFLSEGSADEALSQLKQLCKDFPAEMFLYHKAGYDEKDISELIQWLDERYCNIDLFRYRYLVHMSLTQAEKLAIKRSESGESIYPDQADNSEIAAVMRYLAMLGAWGACVSGSEEYHDLSDCRLPVMILDMYTEGLSYIEDWFMNQYLPDSND